MTAAKPSQNSWSAEALFDKSLLYVGEMERYTPDDWQFGLFSSLSLELLARAALANISPTLLAARGNREGWRNIHHALGYQPTAKAFTPKSVDAGELLFILNELLPDFTKELVDFCVTHIARRNSELHSGEEAFVGFGTSEWLPKFYATCEVFLRSMGKSLGEFFRDTASVTNMIAVMRDTAAKSVEKEIQAQRKAWEQRSPEDRKVASDQAIIWATRHVGHRAICPACGSTALLQGSPQGSVTTLTEQEDEVVQKQTLVPSSFECVACGLKIAGLSKLTASGLGDAFTATSTYSPAQFFNLYTDDDLEEARASAEPEFEEDLND